MEITNALKKLSDDALLRRLSKLIHDHRRVEAELIAHIAEVDERRLFASQATSSMFAYCTERLHLSEGEAFLRIQVARATRRHPMLLEMLADGRLHLTGIGKLVPHLALDNRDELLERATHKSKREIEALVAELQPRPDVPASIGKLPARAAFEPRPDEVGPSSAEPLPVSEPLQKTELRPAEVARPVPIQPLAPERYKVQFTAGGEFREKLARLQALMRSSVPDGDLATIIEQAVTEKLERLEAKRFGRMKAPRKTIAKTDTRAKSRYVPAAVRREVDARDGGRCAFVDDAGKRCGARERLEFHHHDRPYGRGGDHRPKGIRLMCRTHNTLLAEREYGKEWMDRFRRGSEEVARSAAREGLR